MKLYMVCHVAQYFMKDEDIDKLRLPSTINTLQNDWKKKCNTWQYDILWYMTWKLAVCTTVCKNIPHKLNFGWVKAMPVCSFPVKRMVSEGTIPILTLTFTISVLKIHNNDRQFLRSITEIPKKYYRDNVSSHSETSSC